MTDAQNANIEPADAEQNSAIEPKTVDPAQRIRELEAEIGRYKAEQEQSEWKAKVSADTGIPADLLRGDSLEEIQAHAKAIKDYATPKPKAPAVHGVDRHPHGPLPHRAINYIAAAMDPSFFPDR
ncbi:hypothetical protein [Bifidobacterium sp. SO4]|uniref:hypothetical protein n=1 Tax=Bifidobacterium sp. SO4 TaxID=2809030 RepID=UPI001BDD036F|nr:hypothetical protein [Bifidobacterium sp. SO4]MBT1169602.1 hypothetical protein [Bifidobacterium sp. SO4]